MRRLRALLLIVVATAIAACAPSTPPPPAVVPQGEDRYLVDPLSGYPGPVPPQVATKFDAAWRFILAGDETEGRRLLAEVRKRAPEFPPALLAEAAIDIRAERYDEALGRVDLALQRVPEYTAARIYEAEIATREGRTRPARDLYAAIAARPDAPPFARERLAALESRLFDEIYAAARAASGRESVALLREALAVREVADARILLAGRLLEQRSFDEARRELEPILDTAATLPEVQEILAEIDAGLGRYEEAIARYDRLARRTRNERHLQRLEEIKREWSAANMPTHYRQAVESTSLNRADLATLLYWTVPSIRFAQNLGSPPIAVDVEDVAAREEVIRAIAIGLFDVDPVTRRVSPYRTITAAQLSSYLSRILTRRGAACARGLSGNVLAACGVTDPLSTAEPQDFVSGRTAQRSLEQVAKALD